MSDNWVVQNLENALNTWNEKLAEIWQLVTQSPEQFKGGTIWNVIVNIHGALQAIGLALLVLFFVVGVMRTCGNFAEVKKPEHALKLFIRFALAKGAVTYGLELMMALFKIVQGVISTIMNAAGFGTATQTVLPSEIVTAVEDCGFFESIPLWAVTLIGGVLAYFVSGRALRPLRSFAAQVENIQPSNLAQCKVSEDVLPEFRQFSRSFNQMLERLNNAFAAQRQFTGNAAHELRTPLALMQAQIELFASEHPTSQPQTAELLGLLQEQTERMSRMTKVLLEMSALSSVPCEDDVELGPLSEEVLTDLAPLAENRGIALNCAGDALVIGSDTLLYRLVFNLVENAIRYSRSGSTASVSISDSDSHVLLRVKDEGPGIPKKYRESIFQPFFRLDKSRSRAYGGAGLGLALVWEIATLHGGAVEVEASSENGTTMLVSLPKRSAASTEQ